MQCQVNGTGEIATLLINTSVVPVPAMHNDAKAIGTNTALINIVSDVVYLLH